MKCERPKSTTRTHRFCSLRVLALIALTPFFAATSRAQAESKLYVRPPQFEVSQEVQNRIEFWKLVFTRYGENQLVFHHREHPWIIYSVLDLSDYIAKYSGKELSRYSSEAIDDEMRRIQDSLRRLSDQGAPQSPAERRLYQLFRALPGRLSQNLALAADAETIRYQKGVRELFRDGVIRSGRYLHAMEQVFAKEGLPIEVTRLPLVESSFNYNAYSSVGAAGIWQFMRATGKKYLRIDNAIDERRDPIMATRAAARYLGDAYNRIGSWPLAITSYNHGVTGVLRAINETGSKDLGTIIQKYDGEAFGFASKNFYSEFMAALEVEQHADKYFPGISKEAPWRFDEIRLARPLGYRDLVRLSGGDEDEVEKLNRALMAPITSGRVKIPSGFIVRVPQGRGRAVLASLGGEMIRQDEVDSVLRAQTKKGKEEPVTVASTDKKRRDDHAGLNAYIGTSYTVMRGDTLSSIAKHFGVSQNDLRKANGFSETASLRPGAKVLIPKGSRPEPEAAPEEKTEKAAAEKSAPAPSGVTNYQVTAGDTVGSIASRFGVSTAALLKANPGLNPKRVRVGKTIRIPAGRPGTTTAVTGESKGRMYTVQRGDTLYNISRKLGVPVSKLTKLNPGVQKGIKPGQELLTGVQ